MAQGRARQQRLALAPRQFREPRAHCGQARSSPAPSLIESCDLLRLGAHEGKLDALGNLAVGMKLVNAQCVRAGPDLLLAGKAPCAVASNGGIADRGIVDIETYAGIGPAGAGKDDIARIIVIDGGERECHGAATLADILLLVFR